MCCPALSLFSNLFLHPAPSQQVTSAEHWSSTRTTTQHKQSPLRCFASYRNYSFYPSHKENTTHHTHRAAGGAQKGML